MGYKDPGVKTPDIRMLRRQLSQHQIPKWREEDGVIYFSVTSDGTTGEDWISRLESKGFSVGDHAKQVLRSPDFKPTKGVTTEVAVLKGVLFGNNDRSTKNVRTEADKRKLGKPEAELACLIRDKFTDKEIEVMGLWYIVAMHEPVNNFTGDSYLLIANRFGDGCGFDVYYSKPDHEWGRDSGFAFVVPPTSTKVVGDKQEIISQS